MAKLTVTGHDGTSRTVAAESGSSLMEVIRDHDFTDLPAICGGACACATCHVLVDAAQLALLPPVGPEEAELLDSLERRQANSRLSCQIPFTAALDGLRVTIAPAE